MLGATGEGGVCVLRAVEEVSRRGTGRAQIPALSMVGKVVKATTLQLDRAISCLAQVRKGDQFLLCRLVCGWLALCNGFFAFCKG